MSDTPLPSLPVSIITPAYNAERYLQQTIESVLRQTFRDFEMVIVDDGSTDGTAALASRYAAASHGRIRLIRQRNRGIAAARNVALDASRGRYIALLDSDDLWLPGYLAHQLAILEQRPDIAVLSANAINFGGPSDGELLLNTHGSSVVTVSLLTLIQREDAVSIFSVFRRDLLRAVGAFDERLHRSEDYDLWLRAAAAGLQVAINPRPLGLYRRRPDSLSADETLMLDAMQRPLLKVREGCGDPRIQAAIDAQLAAIVERRLVARARTALVQGDMTALASRFTALADATGARRYRLASWLTGKAPATIRWAYRCKRTLGQLSGSRRRSRARALAAPHGMSRAEL
jgi:hypothetical protein